MTIALEPDLEDRLVRYCAVDTQSDLDSPTTPSTACQLDLSRMLVAELEAMGAEDVVLTEYGAVLATVPGNAPGPTIGFLGHVDTAPQCRTLLQRVVPALEIRKIIQIKAEALVG